nr:hypothetical protein [Tanacetum cinerariifolium]
FGRLGVEQEQLGASLRLHIGRKVAIGDFGAGAELLRLSGEVPGFAVVFRHGVQVLQGTAVGVPPKYHAGQAIARLA